ncbi:hatching enzyme 1.2-like [Lutzomyia longipalpis]|uniref:Metalloendopeptidase n=1 Tax=Lutzomyia longipalpis TaxID=7200 RepID=A0A1B0CI94_LUTLO|nr:hatching enzyme 1.2-like [Lutzomyia longipalpis]
MEKLIIFAVSLFAMAIAAPLSDSNSTSRATDMWSEYINLSFLGPGIFGVPNENIGKVLENFANIKGNPEEQGSYLEGDLLIPLSRARNGLVAQATRWPNGVVPYEIKGSFSASDMAMIEKAFKMFHAHTCIRFVRHTNEADYIKIVSGRSGCWSSVGRIGGPQEVNLQSPGCLNQIGVPIHEFLHVLGFLHEQNRSDRDKSVLIKWQNIKPGTTDNFQKANAGTTSNYGVSYDFNSVLHYSAHAFSVNGQPTIVAKTKTSANMGQRRGFSLGDLKKVNSMYHCSSNQKGPLVKPTRKGGVQKPQAQPEGTFFENVAAGIANLFKP